MIANMMMYSRPETEGALARFWGAIAERLTAAGIAAPKTMAQDAGGWPVWSDQMLVLSQTCGMPYRLWLHGKVQLVGTPDYGLAGCPAGYYNSPLVVRATDEGADIGAYRAARFAYNARHSQSGYAAPFTHLAPRGWWFSDTLRTGGHAASARAVRDGAADIAALDAVTWNLIERYEPWARDLRVLEWTEPTPGLPFITGAHLDAQRVRGAVAGAAQALGAADRDALMLRGIVDIPAQTYLAVPNPPGDFPEPDGA